MNDLVDISDELTTLVRIQRVEGRQEFVYRRSQFGYMKLNGICDSWKITLLNRFYVLGEPVDLAFKYSKPSEHEGCRFGMETRFVKIENVHWEKKESSRQQRCHRYGLLGDVLSATFNI